MATVTEQVKQYDCMNVQCYRQVPDCGCIDEAFGDLHDEQHITCGIHCSTQAMLQRAERIEHKCCIEPLVSYLIDRSKPMTTVCMCQCHHYWDCKCEEHA